MEPCCMIAYVFCRQQSAQLQIYFGGIKVSTTSLTIVTLHPASLQCSGKGLARHAAAS